MHMLGHSSLASGTISGNRIFIYEIEGLRQTDQTAQDVQFIRQSGTKFIQVPFSQMSDFMTRMNRLGGKIVAIRSAEDSTFIEEQAVKPTE
jgi:phycocyanin-associated, rod